MNTKKINSAEIKNLNATTKDLINMGEWFLYEISYSSIAEAKYYLSANQLSFFLSSDGSVIKETQVTPEDLIFQNQISFSDLPEPPIVKNLILSDRISLWA